MCDILLSFRSLYISFLSFVILSLSFSLQQYIKLKRHLKNIHKITGAELENAHGKARSQRSGISLQSCNLCGKGVRHMKCHLLNVHKLIPGSHEYRTALGANAERPRKIAEKKKKANQERREGLAKIPVSVQAWIGYESRGGLTVDGKGMLRNMRLVIEILEKQSMTIMSLIEYGTVKKSYELLYQALKKRYKHTSIIVILGHLKRFIDWACSEANYPLCELNNREHNFYSKLCRKRGNLENMARKTAEYIPTVDEMGPLIQYSKHRHIVDGMIGRPGDTLDEYSVDLIHAVLAWPLIIRAGARTGVVKNLLVSEVLEAVRSTDGVVIKVKNHKTSSLYGPYQIGIPAREHDMIVNFVQNRSWESEYVFSSKRGKPFSLANIQRFMKKLFRLYGLPRLRIATVRKFLTTQAHKEGNDQIQEATASLLKHSMKTAKRDYKAMQRDLDALDTANRLSKMLQDQLHGMEDERQGDDEADAGGIIAGAGAVVAAAVDTSSADAVTADDDTTSDDNDIVTSSEYRDTVPSDISNVHVPLL